MKSPLWIVLALLVVAATGVAAPVVAVSIECAEDGGADCCGLDCALCLCCSHAPPTALSELDGRSGGELDGSVEPEPASTPRQPWPRKILHVPRSAPLR